MSMHVNAPGHWDFFISYTQMNPYAIVLAEKLYHTLEKQGKTVWMDVNMETCNRAAMEEGVRNSGCVIAIVTDGDGAPGKSYFEREACLRELRWAINSSKFIQPVIWVNDKRRVGEFMRTAPEDLQHLCDVDWVDMNRGHPVHWKAGVDRIITRIHHTYA